MKFESTLLQHGHLHAADNYKKISSIYDNIATNYISLIFVEPNYFYKSTYTSLTVIYFTDFWNTICKHITAINEETEIENARIQFSGTQDKPWILKVGVSESKYKKASQVYIKSKTSVFSVYSNVLTEFSLYLLFLQHPSFKLAIADEQLEILALSIHIVITYISSIATYLESIGSYMHILLSYILPDNSTVSRIKWPLFRNISFLLCEHCNAVYKFWEYPLLNKLSQRLPECEFHQLYNYCENSRNDTPVAYSSRPNPLTPLMLMDNDGFQSRI